MASGIDGELRATRLPGGDYTLVIGSAEGARHAVLHVTIPAGALASHTLTLAEDHDAARRFLEVVAGSGAVDNDASLESAR